MKPTNTICLWFGKDAPAAGGDLAKRAFEAMMTMKKIDIATIESARRG
jgi:predicted 3-demethylubiquinone-9 3-methyltransferase (glyoxalase superfamily)